tara:strand:- start:19 stop:543 length:525 start_codon:yes stop_codon:yes gene_type:complete
MSLRARPVNPATATESVARLSHVLSVGQRNRVQSTSGAEISSPVPGKTPGKTPDWTDIEDDAVYLVSTRIGNGNSQIHGFMFRSKKDSQTYIVYYYGGEFFLNSVRSADYPSKRHVYPVENERMLSPIVHKDNILTREDAQKLLKTWGHTKDFGNYMLGKNMFEDYWHISLTVM